MLMDIARDYEIVACQYSVALFGGAMTPQIRTSSLHACAASDSAAKVFFEIILSFFGSEHDLKGFCQEYKVLGLERYLCTCEAAGQLFSLAERARGICRCTNSEKIGLLREVHAVAAKCGCPDLEYGLKLLVLNQAIRFRIIEPMLNVVSEIMRDVEKMKTQADPWVPQSFDAAFRG